MGGFLWNGLYHAALLVSGSGQWSVRQLSVVLYF